MINNVIFDFGNVLVRFEPSYMVGKYVDDENDRRLLEEVVFDRRYWDRLDAGTISDEEVVAACRERVPTRLHPAVERIYYNWIYNIPEIEGMRELVKELRSRGVRLFLLSNISTYFANHSHEIPILKYFDKCIFSAEAGFCKPSREIFEHLCKECDVSPKSAVFIDDSEKNVRGAENFGIKSYLFDGDAAKLKKHLDSIIC